jgi:hypothetical protein
MLLTLQFSKCEPIPQVGVFVGVHEADVSVVRKVLRMCCMSLRNKLLKDDGCWIWHGYPSN